MFPCHKLVLSAASPVLRRVLATPAMSAVFMFGLSSLEVNNILQFLYTGQVSLRTSEVQNFLKIAEKLEISLAEEIEDPLIRNDQSKRSKVSTDSEDLKVDPFMKEEDVEIEDINFDNKEDTIEDEFTTLETEDTDLNSDPIDPEMPSIGLNKKKISLDENDLKKSKNIKDFVNSLFTKMENGRARCNICGKESSNPQIYRAHAESHIQGLKFPCKNCDTVYGTRSLLQKHLKVCSIMKQIQGQSSNEDALDNQTDTEDTTNLTDFQPRSQSYAFPHRNAGCWSCMTRLPDGGAQCNYCQKVFPMLHGCTSNANRHLQSKHFDEPAVKALIESLREKKRTRLIKP